MKFETKEIEYCKLSVHAEADLETINSRRELVLLEFKDVKVSGFRPGKATLEVIKMRYKKEIDERVKVRLAEDAFQQVINEQKIRPMGAPRVSDIKLNADKFNCDLTFLKQPDFELSQYKEFEIPKGAEIISIQDLSEKILQQVRVQNGTSKPYEADDFINTGDSIIVDYEVSVDGIVAPEIKGVKEAITVGQSAFSAVDENLLGMKTNETREFDIVAPATAPEKYRNKTLHFTITLAMGAKQISAPLDNTLAEKLKFKDMDELRANITGMASSRVKDYERQHSFEQICKRIQESHSFKLPEFLVTSEAQYQAKMVKKDWEKITDEEKDEFFKTAEGAVRLTLVLDKIRETEPLAQLTDEETASIVKENVGRLIAETNQKQDVDEVLQSMSKRGTLAALIGRIRDEHTLMYILGTCKILE